MFVLHVDMKVRRDSQSALEQTYAERFRPAIGRQEGFCGVELLRPQQDDGDYRLSIAFERQEQQRKWVATELHREVWSAMEGHCAEYSVKYYSSVQ